MIIKVHSPTRVDLAGGTVDCWPLYSLVGDCVTVNLSIDIFTGCELEPLKGNQIHLEISDLKYEKTFSDLAELLANEDKDLCLVKAVVSYFKPTAGFRLKTFSQSPVGGGLGGSSSLCISLMKAFLSWNNQVMDTRQLVLVAHNLEAQVLRTPTGTQDYFPAAHPGLNLISYTAEGPRQEVLQVDDVFSQHMFLVYTGKPHHSGINNWQVIKAAVEGDEKTLLGLKKIAEIGRAMEGLCRKGDWGGLAKLFHQEYEARILLSPSFSSPEIESLQKLCLQSGADAVKICGAGGGGCVMVWVSPARREKVINACQQQGFEVLSAKPVAKS